MKYIITISLLFLTIFLLVYKQPKKHPKLQTSIQALPLTNCYNTLEQCNVDCKGYRCKNNCNEGNVCLINETNCYGSQDECKTTCNGYKCIDGQCQQKNQPCTSNELTTNICFFNLSNCQSNCRESIFNTLSSTSKYKIINLLNNRQLQARCNNTNDENVYVLVQENSPNANNHDMFWKFIKSSDYSSSNKKYFIQEVCGSKILQCPIQYNGKCTINEALNTGLTYAAFTIEPSEIQTEADQGICYLKSNNLSGYLSVGCVDNICGWDSSSITDPYYVTVSANKNGMFTKWKIVQS